MDKEDIIRMVREAGIPETATQGVFIANSDDLGRLIAAEREACANVCDSYDVADDVCSSDTAEGIAIAIRARGQG